MLKLPFHNVMNFEPVAEDQDELLDAIPNGVYQDDVWQLRDDIDPDQLDHFWDETLKELKDNSLD